MNQGQIDKSKKTKRLVLTLRQKMQHYYIILLPFLLFGYIVYDNIKNSNEFGLGSWLVLSLSVILFIIQFRQLRFKEFKGNFSTVDLHEALKRTANELEWHIKTENDHYIQAFTYDPFNKKGGDLITIITKDKSSLINSVSDFTRRSFPLLSLTNKNNIRTFIKHLEDSINHRPENKDYLIPQKEWTTKRVVIRLFMYFFWLFVIGMSIKMIINPYWLKSIWAGLIGIIFGVGYITIDIKMILRRKKYERTTSAKNNASRKVK